MKYTVSVRFTEYANYMLDKWVREKHKMKNKGLVLILTLILSVSAAAFLCGCEDENYDDVPTSTDGESIDASVNIDENENESRDSDTDGEAENTADKQDENTEPTDSGQKPSSENSIKNSSVSSKNYPANAPWEGFDMYGIPDALDTLKKDDGDLLVLVNKLHAVSKNYTPTDMVAIDGKYTTNQGLEMKSEAYDAYLEMRKAARKDEIKFKICSAYRTYSTQEYLFNNYLGSMGEELRNIRSAYPGRSEHHTGYAIDITSKSMGWTLSQTFADYPEGEWINEHCSEYGFIIRYPKGKTDITGYDYEPWHLRYVGVDIAQEITEKGITLEEYLGR